MSGRPSTIRPPPTPTSPETNSTWSRADAPPRGGARRARRGRPRWRRRSGRRAPSAGASRSPSGTSRQPRFGRHRHEAVAAPDDARRPRRRRRRAPSAGAGSRSSRRDELDEAVGDRSSTDAWPRWRGRRGRCSRTSPPSPTTAAASESTSISSGEDDRRLAGSAGRPATAGPACPASAARSSATRSAGDQLADQRRGSRCGSGRSGRRARSASSGPLAWSSRTIALRLARRTVSLRWPTASGGSSTVLCSSLSNRVTDSYIGRAGVKRRARRRRHRRGRPGPHDDAPLGHPRRPRTSRPRRSSRGSGGRPAARSSRSPRATARPPAASPIGSAIPRAHGSYEALLADPDVDAVYIPLPNHLHAEWTIAAARAGKHVLCEKPLALTAADAERMVAAAEAAGVHLMEAFMYRHHPSWVAVRELVASGRIGTLTAVQSWFSFYNDDPANIRNIRDFGGGALYDVGCYASTCRGCCSAASRSGSRARSSGTARPATASTSSRRPARVRERPRHVRLLDPDRDRPARRRLRQRRPDLDRDPVQHPAGPPDAGLRHEGRRSARGAGDRDADVRDGGPVHGRGRALRGGGPRRPADAGPARRTRSRTCGSSSGCSPRPTAARRRASLSPASPSRPRSARV